jgi:hypothetical protein
VARSSRIDTWNCGYHNRFYEVVNNKLLGERNIMSKVILIIVGVIIAILGILTLFPKMTMGLWLSIALIGIGIVGMILGFLDKRKAAIKEEPKEIKLKEQAESKIE